MLDPADEELRERYVDLALQLGRHTDAVKLLERLIATARNEASKARASVRLGETLLAQGDPKRAKTILSDVMASWRLPADVELRAARALRAIHETAYEWSPLCQVLDRLALLERDDDRRREINERLASVAIKARDTVRAIEANERLLSTGARAAALEALGPLYRSSANWKKWARLLEMQAKETDDASEGTRAPGARRRGSGQDVTGRAESAVLAGSLRVRSGDIPAYPSASRDAVVRRALWRSRRHCPRRRCP